jgi:hypothetical protein
MLVDSKSDTTVRDKSVRAVELCKSEPTNAMLKAQRLPDLLPRWNALHKNVRTLPRKLSLDKKHQRSGSSCSAHRAFRECSVVFSNKRETALLRTFRVSLFVRHSLVKNLRRTMSIYICRRNK